MHMWKITMVLFQVLALQRHETLKRRLLVSHDYPPGGAEAPIRKCFNGSQQIIVTTRAPHTQQHGSSHLYVFTKVVNAVVKLM